MSEPNIKRTVCGVGYRLTAPTTESNGSRKPYSVWKNMIYRCYSKDNIAYGRYGGRGVIVSEEWHCFDTFREDIRTLKGYDEVLFYNNEIELDKDGISECGKIYSKETCQWLPIEEHRAMAKRSRYLPHLTRVRLVALSPNDEVFCITNIPMFADEHGLLRSGIYGTLMKNGSKTHLGWCFKRVEEFDEVVEISRDDYKQIRHGVVPLRYEVIKDGRVKKTLNNVVEAAEYMGCSVSNINQRTRDGKEYRKHGVVLRRKQKERTISI